jgi:hypothetical protein
MVGYLTITDLELDLILRALGNASCDSKARDLILGTSMLSLATRDIRVIRGF